MVKRSWLIAGVAVVLGLIVFTGPSSGRSDGSGSDSGGSRAVPVPGPIQIPLGSGAVYDGDDPLDLAPDGESNNDLIGVVNPGNVPQSGPIYTGPDPLDLAPGEEGRGDLIGPVNPGNLIAGGPVYTGPDPLGLGGGN